MGPCEPTDGEGRAAAMPPTSSQKASEPPKCHEPKLHTKGPDVETCHQQESTRCLHLEPKSHGQPILQRYMHRLLTCSSHDGLQCQVAVPTPIPYYQDRSQTPTPLLSGVVSLRFAGHKFRNSLLQSSFETITLSQRPAVMPHRVTEEQTPAVVLRLRQAAARQQMEQSCPFAAQARRRIQTHREISVCCQPCRL